ncbi:MAG: DUF4810 domain-containing protein [Betaproteobacteria bacterium]|nr:DUF4810 domain-containing protein [Betaproteobacteria bacterium]
MLKFHHVAVLALACILIGCAGTTSERPLYQWESYQAQTLAWLKGDGTSPEAQIAALERDLEKIKATDSAPPPGFYAHLGMLYAETGNDARAIECFTLEKQRFPEAAAFMDRLLNQKN